MLTSSQDCRAIGGLLEGHALDVLEPGQAGVVRAHLAVCAGCREEHHCLAAVAAHLPLLRGALAGGAGRRPWCLSGAAGGRSGARRRHGAARGAGGG
ncbi:zf-HC2 domain-containing protein, partial [Streptomyces sp. NPDC050388]|uniref:zf-HC2 domain-containing protein n=1 Tax=Streptomyces sp. NPDC050388 TaxID=3155781 RepID=UPI00343478C4